MSLDKRLEDILHFFDDESPEFRGRMIQDVKQAFIDEGWLDPAEFDEMIERQADFKKRWGLMTGPEWLARFRDEFPRAGLLPEYQDVHAQVMGAARRAAGVDE